MIETGTYLFGETACRWYMHNSYIPDCETGHGKTSGDCAPTKAAALELLESMPYLGQKIHVMVFSNNDSRHIKNLVSHVVDGRSVTASVASIGSNLFLCKPEMALMQAARTLSELELVDMVSQLCSKYFIYSEIDGSLGVREPLTNLGELTKFHKRHSGQLGCVMLARAVGFAHENAASPKEIEMILKLTLPSRLGGMCIPAAKMNYVIDLSTKTKDFADSLYYVADACWPKEKVILEYDSDFAHLTSEQKTHDEIRRRTLIAQGFNVITVTRKQINSILEMEKIARLLCKALGRQLRCRSANFEAARETLFEFYREKTKQDLELIAPDGQML